MRLIIDANGILTASNFFPAGGFKKLGDDLRHRIILKKKLEPP